MSDWVIDRSDPITEISLSFRKRRYGNNRPHQGTSNPERFEVRKEECTVIPAFPKRQFQRSPEVTSKVILDVLRFRAGRYSPLNGVERRVSIEFVGSTVKRAGPRPHIFYRYSARASVLWIVIRCEYLKFTDEVRGLRKVKNCSRQALGAGGVVQRNPVKNDDTRLRLSAVHVGTGDIASPADDARQERSKICCGADRSGHEKRKIPNHLRVNAIAQFCTLIVEGRGIGGDFNVLCGRLKFQLHILPDGVAYAYLESILHIFAKP